MEYVLISNTALGNKIKGRIKSGPAYVTETCNVMFNCIERAIVHNDATWLNKGAAYARASGPYITGFMKVAKTVSPFNCEKGEFGGKMLKNKRDKWRKIDADNHGDYRDENWYKFLVQEFDAMLKDRTEAVAKKSDKTEEELLAAFIKSTLGRADKHDGWLDALYAAVVAKKNAPVQEVAEGIEEERKEERKAA